MIITDNVDIHVIGFRFICLVKGAASRAEDLPYS